MRFENPLGFLYIFWSVPIIILFWIVVLRRKRSLREKFINKPLLPEIAPSLNMPDQYFKTALLSISIILILFALTRPQLGFRWKEIKRKGLDIIFVVDTSKSMLADDISPNRLERTKLSIKSMLNEIKGDRVGLVAFAGEAFLQCPLTLDYDGFLIALEDLGVDTIPRGGTSITSGIEEALKAYQHQDKRYRTLILISDGEEHEGDAIRVAETAKEEKVKIFCIGVGSSDGSRIPLSTKNRSRSFLKDSFGLRVKTHLNEKLLKEIAFITGGAYIHSSLTNFGLRRIYRKKISRMEKRTISGEKLKYYNERFQIPLFFAIILLCLELMIRERKRLR